MNDQNVTDFLDGVCSQDESTGEYVVTNRIMDSVWTIRFKPGENGTVKILSHSRDDDHGYEYEHQTSDGYLIECIGSGNRMAVGLAIYTTTGVQTYVVYNMDNIFSYPLKKTS